VIVATPAARPAITDVRLVVTPSGYGCTSTSHAFNAAVTSPAGSAPVA
jgi:hypothetical protein